MRELIIPAIILFISSKPVGAQRPDQKRDMDCQRSWKYQALPRAFDGTVVWFEHAQFFCGHLATASNAIIRQKDGKLVRILTICFVKAGKKPAFQPGDVVKVLPNEGITTGVAVPIDRWVCTIDTAWFGRLEKR